jgi:hypothetical protein
MHGCKWRLFYQGNQMVGVVQQLDPYIFKGKIKIMHSLYALLS